MKLSINEKRLASWLSGEGASPVPFPRRDSEWRESVRAARRSGLSGLVLREASRMGLYPPALFRHALRDQATNVAASNVHLLHELERVVAWLNRAGFPVMLLKGAALNLTLYDHLDQRPMSDLDLLIKPDTVAEVITLLCRHGCRRGAEPVREGFFPTYYYETELMTDGPRPARIDLHVRPLRPLRTARTLPDDAFWARAQPVAIGHAAAVMPCPEHMLIHLAAHAAYHGCERLIWLYDLKRWIETYRNQMDWAMFAEHTRRWRLTAPVLKALRDAQSVLGSFDIDEETADLRGQRVSWRDRLALRHAPRDVIAPVSHVLVNLLCTPGIRFRLGYLWSLLRPSRSHLAEIYPFRHAGWTWCAMVWRSIRTVLRGVVPRRRWWVTGIRRLANRSGPSRAYGR